jgi:hypothetical protein
MANTIADDSQMESWSGIFTLTGGGTNQTAIYGSQNLARDFEIGAGDTLTIEANGSLTVNENVTLSNSGTIVNKSSLMIAGTLTNHASINNDGTILVAGTLMNLSESDLGTVLYRVNVTGGAADAEYASPGAAVTLTPETVIPEGMTAVWMLGNETISNSSFEMPASAVSISRSSRRTKKKMNRTTQTRMVPKHRKRKQRRQKRKKPQPVHSRNPSRQTL